MVRIDRRAIVFIMFFFISAFVFPQEKQADPEKKLREEILAVYQTKGQQGLREFLKKSKKQITNKFILDFAESGLKERKEEWLKACEIMSEEKRDEKTLADVYLRVGEYFRLISNYTKSLDLFYKALPFFAKLNDSNGQGNVFLRIGILFYSKGDDLIVLEMCNKALPFFEKTANSKGQGNVYMLKGIILSNIGKRSKAMEMYAKALSFFEKSDDLLGQGNIHMYKGDYYKSIHNYSKATAMYNKALHSFKKAESIVSQGQVYHRIGDIFYFTYETTIALYYYKKALDIFKETGDLLGQGILYNRIADIYLRTDEGSIALKIYNKALSIFKKIGDKRDQGHSFWRKGDIYFYNGENLKAFHMYNKALNIFKQTQDSIGQGNVYLNKGRLYSRACNYLRAFEMYNEASIFYNKVDSFLDQGNVYLEKGRIFFFTGNNSKALDMYSKALSFYEKAGDPIAQGNLYFCKGEVYFSNRNDLRTMEMYDKALAFFIEAGDQRSEGNIYLAKGDIHFHSGENSKALAMYSKALTYLEKTKNCQGQGCAYFRKGRIYFDSGDYLKALSMHEKGIEMYKKTGDIGMISICLLEKARIFSKLGKKDKSLFLLEESLKDLERIRQQTAFSDMQRTFMETVYDQYKETAFFLLENKYYNKGFKYAESMRARVFLDQMAEGLIKMDKGLKLELKEERDSLVGRLSALSRQMQETGGKEEKKLQKLKEEYRKVESEFDDLLIKIRLENPLYASVNYPQPITVRDLQTEVLKKGETLLSYFISPEKAYAFIVTQKKFKVKQLKVNEKEINGYVQRYLQAIKENNANDMKRFGSLLFEKLFKPVEKYLKKSKEIIIVPTGQLERIPFESLIVNKKNPGHPVYLLEKYRVKYIQGASLLSILRKYDTGKSTAQGFIGFGDPVYDYENFKQGKEEQGSGRWPVTSGQLQVAPFGERMKNWNDGRLEFWNVGMAPFGLFFYACGESLATEGTETTESKKNLNGTRNTGTEHEIKEIHRDRYARAGGIMDRLPKSGEEVQSIARLFEKESLKNVVYIREQAAEEKAKAADMKDFAYIHFSCHGLLNDDFQSLVLSQLPTEKSTEDGYFTLNEIMNCDYNAKLVVLSACETGSGKMYRGEGVTGLTRAVMYAGTPAVVASLWKVDDIATKELMVTFYKNLLEKKMDKVEALRQAKLELIKNPNYSSPLYWSAFIMYGE